MTSLTYQTSTTVDLTTREQSLLYHSKFLHPLSDYTPPSAFFNILHHNAHSLPSKIDSYNTLPLSSYDVISISETWLKPSLPDSHVTMPGYKIYRKDRMGKTGGGAALYIRQTYCTNQLSFLSNIITVADSIWVKISIPKRRPIILGSIYLPPSNNKSDFIDQLNTTLENPCFTTSDIILSGDFNINFNTNSTHRLKLENLTSSLNLRQTIDGFTYICPNSGHESLLDLIFVSKTLQISQSRVLHTDLSDHYAIACSINIKPPKKPKTIIQFRNYSSGMTTLIDDAYYNSSLISTISNSKDPNLQTDTLENWIDHLITKHFPLRSMRLRQESPPWISTDLKKLIVNKNKLFRKATSAPAHSRTEAWNTYKIFRNKVQSEIKKTKKDFYSDQFSKNTKTFFSETNRLLGNRPHQSNNPPELALRDNSGTLKSDPKDVAELYNDFCTSKHTLTDPSTSCPHLPTCSSDSFKFMPVSELEVAKIFNKLDKNKRGGPEQIPASVYKTLSYTIIPALTIIINTCFTSSMFPTRYKRALVIPKFKKGDRQEPNNYRPISSLPILSKVIETAIHLQITSHLNKLKLLSDRQFGFRKGISTEQALHVLLDNAYRLLDKPDPQYISLLSLDISKAFDSVNHEKLLSKLPTSFSFSQNATRLVSSYLSGRSQITKINSSFSTPGTLSQGVPQGSILGPLLFNIMINDLLKLHPMLHAYADDTVLIHSSHTIQSCIQGTQNLLEHVSAWLGSNNFTLNMTKTSCIMWSNKMCKLPSSVELIGHNIPILPSIQILGVTVDSKLSFTPHCNKACSSVSSLLYAFRRIRHLLTAPQATLLYTSVIRPRLEYCSTLLIGTCKANLDNLEKCQNKAVRIIFKVPQHTHTSFSVTHARDTLELPSLTQRRNSRIEKIIALANKPSPTTAFSLLISRNISHKTTHMTRSGTSQILPFARTNLGKRRLSFVCIFMRLM